MSNPKIVLLLLRISIASVFLYAAVAATLSPDNWVGYIPKALGDFLPLSTLLLGFSFYELALAIWLLVGWKTFYPAILAAMTLLAIIVTNVSQTDILFRDLAIFFAAVALTVGSKEERR